MGSLGEAVSGRECSGGADEARPYVASKGRRGGVGNGMEGRTGVARSVLDRHGRQGESDSGTGWLGRRGGEMNGWFWQSRWGAVAWGR
jgi:hypothetical protein